MNDSLSYVNWKNDKMEFFVWDGIGAPLTCQL